jgi:hypothetical protein
MQYVRAIWSNTTEQNLFTPHISFGTHRYTTCNSMHIIQAIQVSDIRFVQLFIPIMQENHIVHTKNVVQFLHPKLLDINTSNEL